MQGGKNQRCAFKHTIETDDGGTKRAQGKLTQLQCEVKFHFYTPLFINRKASTNKMAIICYGEHTHPPPPPRKIPAAVKEKFLKAISAFGVGEATARRLLASPILPIMLNGKTSFEQEHVALANQDVINYLIHKERIKEFPWGTDFQGTSQ
jgi:hypothetical protein